LPDETLRNATLTRSEGASLAVVGWNVKRVAGAIAVAVGDVCRSTAGNIDQLGERHRFAEPSAIIRLKLWRRRTQNDAFSRFKLLEGENRGRRVVLGQRNKAAFSHPTFSLSVAPLFARMNVSLNATRRRKQQRGYVICFK